MKKKVSLFSIMFLFVAFLGVAAVVYYGISKTINNDLIADESYEYEYNEDETLALADEENNEEDNETEDEIEQRLLVENDDFEEDENEYEEY